MGLLDSPQLDDSVGDFFQIREELARAPKPRAECRSQIVEFYAGRSVFITGASGFIGKVLIEKLLRTCPQIKRIFVLIRPKWNKRPDERLAELLACPLFAGLRDTVPNLAERVIVVEGDVTQQNLGLSGQNLLRLSKEVSVIFHSAATVKFDEPLKQSIGINIAGTKNMLEFCRRCSQLAGLVHVSTAYANCNRAEIDEHVYPMQMDPEKLIQMADWLDLETMQELKRRLLADRPNTYTYTKALAEWLIVKSARDLPVVVCRPSIVCASQSEPFSGWIDNVNGPTGVILGAGKGLLRSMFAETDCVADLVPVDKVINLVVTLGWFAHINKHQKHLNEAAESFTESLLEVSAGPSSLAGSSAASTNGRDDDLSPQTPRVTAVAAATTFELAARALSHQASGQVAVAAAGGKTTGGKGPHARKQQQQQQQQHRPLTSGPLSSASSLSPSSSPSLSGAEEEEEEEYEDEDERVFAASRRHHKHQQRHLLAQRQHDAGYASRSDYAHSVSSSDSSSLGGAGQKRRHQRQRAATANNNNNNQAEKPTICISESGTPLQKDGLEETVDDGETRHQDGLTTGTSICNTLIAQTAHDGELEEKLKRFRQLTRNKLNEQELPEELADIPVFHCTSGGENSVSWGRVQLLVITALTMFPSISTYRYPCGSFTNNKLLDDFYRLTLHYIPALIADTLTRLVGGKPVIVKIFKKFDQAALVLKAFTSKQWDFKYDNRLFLMHELMNEEDRRLFDCDIKSLDWERFITDYVVGVKKFLLKEPMTNLEQARKNLNFVYYRNLSLQVLFFSTVTYCLASTFGLLAA